MDRFKVERRELLEKLEKITSDMTKKERLITTLENQKESLQNQIDQKAESLTILKDEFSTDKTSHTEKIEQLRAEHQATLDNLTQLRMDNERDRALKEQQLHFNEMKI